MQCFRRMHRKWAIAFPAGLVVALLGFGFVPFGRGAATPEKRGQRIAFDVAEDGTRFVFDETPVHGDGLPAYGGEFVTQGYLYPPGTIECDGGDCNGVNSDGSPEFPDLVVGTWTCYGVHIGDGAHTVSGPWVISTQLFDFGKAPGAESIVTQGFELADTGVPFQRAITGSTGIGSTGRGEQTQVFRGFNPSAGVTLRVELRTSAP